MISAAEALKRLQTGNRRFVSGLQGPDTLTTQIRRRELANTQEPFATILACSDSRVPPELIFGEGLGDLFVIRVAGNIAASTQIASVEFSALLLGTPLAVVLGHTHCGAIMATLDAVRQGTDGPPFAAASIIDHLRPVVEESLARGPEQDPEALIQHAVRAGISASADHLRHGSPILEKLIRNDELLVVGAEYSLESGLVDFFDGAPGT